MYMWKYVLVNTNVNLHLFSYKQHFSSDTY